LDDGWFDTLGIQSAEMLPSNFFVHQKCDMWEYWERRALPATQKNTSSNEKTKSQKYTNELN